MENIIFEPVFKEEMLSRTFHLEVNQVTGLKGTSRQLGISQSEIVRRLVQDFLDEYKKYQEQTTVKK
jgi:hypothetical protein